MEMGSVLPEMVTKRGEIKLEIVDKRKAYVNSS